MRFFYLGDQPVQVKVQRANNCVDTITIMPSPAPYMTNDVELVNAALENPLFTLDRPKPKMAPAKMEEPILEPAPTKKKTKKEEGAE